MMKNEALFVSAPAEQPQNVGHQQQHFSERGVISVGDLILDQARHLCIWRQNCIDLTRTEFALLASLSRHPGYVKSRDQLIDEICGTNVHLLDRSIDSYVKRLRKKLKAIDPGFREIQTVHGIGYRYRIQMVDREERRSRCGKQLSWHNQVIGFAGKPGFGLGFLAFWDSVFGRVVILLRGFSAWRSTNGATARRAAKGSAATGA